MPNRLQISIFLFVAAAIWASLLVIEGVAVQSTWARPFSTVVGVLVLLLLAFDLWLWKIPLLQGWFVYRPNIRGTWRIQLQSNWIDPKTNQGIPSIAAFLVIRQTFSMLSMRLHTPESSSELLGAEITKASDSTFRVLGIYRNEPRLSVRDRSSIHYGGLVLDITDGQALALSGHYWTDRNTCGEIRSIERKPQISGSYEDANRLFSIS
ncbi:MAG: hypothetical protein Q8R67_05465 [Rhodoferax sp.]|nr:hypothetical protein [Rhodoferax sp.]MDP3651116.1 hypothetical protein [Rhodoferax sp.]